MKNYILMLVGLVAIGMAACKQTDQQTVAVMETEVKAQQQAASEFAPVVAKSAELMKELNETPREVMQSTAFQEVANRAQMLDEKATRSRAELEENAKQLAAISAEYAAGRLSKEEAEQKMAPFKRDSAGIAKLLLTLNNLLDSTKLKLGQVKEAKPVPAGADSDQ